MNFLKSIAATKIFDIPGSNLNSIDAARAARLFDVLIFATEEKELNEAQYLDFQAEQAKNK